MWRHFRGQMLPKAGQTHLQKQPPEHRGAGLAACAAKDPGALKRSRDPHGFLHPILRLCPPLSQQRGPPAPAPCPAPASALGANCEPSTRRDGPWVTARVLGALSGGAGGARSTVAALVGRGGGNTPWLNPAHCTSTGARPGELGGLQPPQEGRDPCTALPGTITNVPPLPQPWGSHGTLPAAALQCFPPSSPWGSG